MLSSPIKGFTIISITGHTNKRINRRTEITIVYNVLAWEPSAANFTKSYFADYLHLINLTGKLNLSKENSLGSSVFPNSNLRQIGPGVL